MRKNYFIHLLPIVIASLFLMPNYAYADAGTPLLWLSVGHLLFGNAVIGIFEGLIVAKIFRVRIRRGVLIMVLANYVSMIAGAAGIWSLGSALNSSINIYNVLAIIVAMFVGSYIATILIEWPFCFWILRGKDKRGALSFKASAVINTVSYAILIPLYLSVSGTSFMTAAKIENVSSFLKTNKAQIYFISPKDGALYKIRANGSNKQKIQDAGLISENTRLFICNNDGKTTLNASWYERKNNRFEDRSIVLLGNVSGLTAVSEACDSKNRFHEREIIDFRPQNMRDWDVHTGTWAIEGLRGENKRLGKSFWIALETPFLSWPISYATILPEDQVICQFGNQIVLFDLNTHQIGLVVFGTRPVVILEE